MSFVLFNCFLKIWESIQSPLGNVWVHSFTFSYTTDNVNVIFKLHSQPTPFHALALVASQGKGHDKLALINEAIKRLGYNTSKYIEENSYVHLNWSCKINFSFISKVDFYVQWILWFNMFIRWHVVNCNVVEN